MLQITAQLQ